MLEDLPSKFPLKIQIQDSLALGIHFVDHF